MYRHKFSGIVIVNLLSILGSIVILQLQLTMLRVRSPSLAPVVLVSFVAVGGVCVIVASLWIGMLWVFGGRRLVDLQHEAFGLALISIPFLVPLLMLAES